MFIDLDGLARPLTVTPRRRLRNLARLMRALMVAPPHVSAPGRLRVLLGYLAPPGAGPVNYKVYWRAMERFGADQGGGP